MEWGLLDRQEDRDYQYFDGVQICVCAIICKTKEICKSELTELFRARDASCPKGKKMEQRKSLTTRNLYIKENIDETVFMFALFKCRKSDKGRN